MKNQFNIEKFNYMSSIFLGILFIILNLYKRNIHLLITFLIISFFVYIFNKDNSLQNRYIDSILFGIIISFILYNFSKLNKKKLNEGFASKDEDSSEEEEDKETLKKIVKKKKVKEDDDDEEEDDDEPYIDAGSTFLKAYKKLDQKQIEGMTNDTKELIETQKNLMETLKTLGPVVTEGKKVLDTFTNYFDN
tara:strand:- start:38 stop:613 length:576 start_codon:yes stop_codon:yes gene_type:complete